MSSASIFSQAMVHVPALLVLGLLIYAAYWLLGMARWPASKWRVALQDRLSVEPQALGGFGFTSLAGISLASLFLELLLVRWIASEIRVFAYFKSLPLIAGFLGFGLGCYLTRRKAYLLYTLAPLLAMVAIVELPWTPLREAGFGAAAFGSNLVGSLVGGLLESLSYLVGIKALVVLAALLYFASLWTARKMSVSEVAMAPAGSSSS
jgi:hypothetical protein